MSNRSPTPRSLKLEDELGSRRTDRGTRAYRLLDGADPSGVPLRQVLELLQREHIRSPDHWLWNVSLHLRH
jgi:hypothetical protein